MSKAEGGGFESRRFGVDIRPRNPTGKVLKTELRERFVA
jgi:hypothetical protein